MKIKTRRKKVNQKIKPKAVSKMMLCQYFQQL